ncbi:MAG TPA: GFA family protein [Nannocystaceae bacterium]|nr:GFA family protein [Nannocystaceae bacterium]
MQASCQCGNLIATIDEGAEPLIAACHCRECQKRSGSPFGVMAYYPRDAVAIRGAASEYTRPTDEGGTFTNGFCASCGSTLYGRASAYPEITGITVGTITDPSFPAPSRSIYEQSRHAWIAMPDATAGFIRGPDGARSR